jgi:serine/threonine protein phosphatase PrpC
MMPTAGLPPCSRRGRKPLVYRKGTLTHLNEDHSLRSLSAEARGGAAANMLTSALSGGPIRKIDLQLEPLAIGGRDVLIVASDGMLSLTDEQIAGVLASGPKPDVGAMTKALIESVDQAQKPHQDNCTIAMFSPGRNRRSARRLGAAVGALLTLAGLGAAIAFAVHRRYF